jgi:hypothetical protein
MTEGPFGAVLAGNMELLGRKLAAPLLLGDRDLAFITLGGFVSFAHRWNTLRIMGIYSRNIGIENRPPKSLGRLSRRLDLRVDRSPCGSIA